MTYFTLLWKARTIEKFRRNYEKEKVTSIVIEHPQMEQRFSQRWRQYSHNTHKRLSRTFKKLYPDGSGVSNFIIYLMTDQTFPNFLLKSLMGFFGGTILTYLCFMFFVFQLSISLIHATIMSSVIGILLTLGLAFSYRIRCLVFLLIPQFFSRVGRYTITCYALVLILTGPATNTLKNSEVLTESMACDQEEIKTSVRRVNELMQKPYQYLKEPLKLMISRFKMISMRLKLVVIRFNRLVLSVLDFIQSSFRWLQSIENVCNKKLDSPYNRCSRLLEDAVNDYKTINTDDLLQLNMSYLTQAVCGDVKPFSRLCYIPEYTDFMDDVIAACVRRRLREFTEQVNNLFDVDLHVLHSYSLNAKGSRTLGQVTAGIVTEIRHRADPLLTWLSWSSYVTSLFLLLIIFRAKYYQHMYVTRSRFDNRYITKEFQELDFKRQRQGRETVLPLNRREHTKYVTSTSFRLVPSEKVYLTRSAVFMAITTFKLLIHMVADYSLYWVLKTIRHHGKHQADLIPGIPDTGVHVTGNGFVAGLFGSVVETLNIPLSKHAPSPIRCLPDPYPPDFRRYMQIVFLIFLLWFFALFEPYGLRLRHLIMGQYRPERARARAMWLYNHILRTRAGFMKYARRKLHREYKYYTESSQTFYQWLDAHFPFQCIKCLLGIGPAASHCLLCGTFSTTNDSDTQLTRCRTPNCPGTYCTTCYSDIGNLCTICLSPADYGDLSDVSLEKGSSDESDNESELDGTSKECQKLIPQPGTRLSKSSNRWIFFRRSYGMETENSISLLESAKLEQRNFPENSDSEQSKNKTANSTMLNMICSDNNIVENIAFIDTIYICKTTQSILNTLLYFNILIRYNSTPLTEFEKPQIRDKRSAYYYYRIKRSRNKSLTFCNNLNRYLITFKTLKLYSKRTFQRKRRRYNYMVRIFKINKEQFNFLNKTEKDKSSNIKDQNYLKSMKTMNYDISVQNASRNKSLEEKSKKENTTNSKQGKHFSDHRKSPMLNLNSHTKNIISTNTIPFVKEKYHKRRKKCGDDLLSLTEIYQKKNNTTCKTKKDKFLRSCRISAFFSDIDWTRKCFKRPDSWTKKKSDLNHAAKLSCGDIPKRPVENNKLKTITNTLLKYKNGHRTENSLSTDETRPRTEFTQKVNSSCRPRHRNIFCSFGSAVVHRDARALPQEKILRRSSSAPNTLSSIKLVSNKASSTKIHLKSFMTRVYSFIFRSKCTEVNFPTLLKENSQKNSSLFQRNDVCKSSKDCKLKNKTSEFGDVLEQQFDDTRLKLEFKPKDNKLKYPGHKRNIEKDQNVEHKIEILKAQEHMKSAIERKECILSAQTSQIIPLIRNVNVTKKCCDNQLLFSKLSPICKRSVLPKYAAQRNSNMKPKCIPVQKLNTSHCILKFKPRQECTSVWKPNLTQNLSLDRLSRQESKQSSRKNSDSIQKPSSMLKLHTPPPPKKFVLASKLSSSSTNCANLIKNFGNEFKKTSKQQTMLNIQRASNEPSQEISITSTSVLLSSTDITMSTPDSILSDTKTACDWWSPILEKKTNTVFFKKVKIRNSNKFRKRIKAGYKRYSGIVTMKAIIVDGHIKFKSKIQT